MIMANDNASMNVSRGNISKFMSVQSGLAGVEFIDKNQNKNSEYGDYDAFVSNMASTDAMSLLGPDAKPLVESGKTLSEDEINRLDEEFTERMHGVRLFTGSSQHVGYYVNVLGYKAVDLKNFPAFMPDPKDVREVVEHRLSGNGFWARYGNDLQNPKDDVKFYNDFDKLATIAEKAMEETDGKGLIIYDTVNTGTDTRGFKNASVVDIFAQFMDLYEPQGRMQMIVINENAAMLYRKEHMAKGYNGSGRYASYVNGQASGNDPYSGFFGGKRTGKDIRQDIENGTDSTYKDLPDTESTKVLDSKDGKIPDVGDY